MKNLILSALILSVSSFQHAVANEQKDTVVVLQKTGRDRRYIKSCSGENVLMVCAFRKYGLTVLSEKTGIEFQYIDQYTRRFSEEESLMTFLLGLKSNYKNYESSNTNNPYTINNK